jgi:molybdopterin-synthase adenylyltransferase
VKQSIGKNKAEAARLQLANFYGTKAEALGVRLAATNAAQLLGGCTLAVDCFDNADSRIVLAEAARATGVPLVHAAIAADGTFGLVRWDERFAADREDAPGQPTCEGGEHLPMIGLVGATLARAIQDFVRAGTRHDYMIALSGVTRTT